LTLAALTGARRAQLLGLRWHNVPLATRRVSFCAGWVEGPHGPELTATKTRRRHVVDLDLSTFAVLVDHAAERGCQARADAFVFSDDSGATASNPNRVTKAFLRQRRVAGVPLVVVSRRLDHRRVSTTLDLYAHAVPGGDAHTATTLWPIMHAYA
jgi:integrase